jgi:PAS domain S-box-containing protein
MSEQLIPLLIFLLLAAAIPTLLGLYALRRSSAPGITEFGLLMLAVAWWILTSALEKTMPTISTRVMWSKFQYIGITSSAVLWFLFALRFTRQDSWLSRKVVVVLWILPIFTVLIAFSNGVHHLLWSDISPATGDLGGLLVYSHGPWFWVQTTYSYLLYLAGTFVLLWAVVRSPKAYRHQLAALIIVGAIPILSNILYLGNFIPIPGLDITPVSFVLSGIVAAWSIFRFRIFDLAPVARDAVIENMWDGVLVLDTQDYLTDINPRARQMLGLHKGDFIGQPVQNSLEAWPVLNRLLQAGAADSRPREVHSSGPPSLTLEVSLTQLKDWRSKALGRLVVLRDISERKRVESLRDKLIHTIVHDLRNPLNNIIASLELMNAASMQNQTALPQAHRELYQTAQVSANRMVALVNSILDINRLESGQMIIERQPSNLQRLVEDLIRLQAPLASLKNIHMEEQFSSDLPPAIIDPILIRRVLQNLLDNAIRYAPQDSTVVIEAHPLPEAFIQCSIRDSGPGIAAELQGRLFEKFATGSDRQGGGLGLTFCKLAIEAHGGKIWAESQQGQGATFSFTLPTLEQRSSHP